MSAVPIASLSIAIVGHFQHEDQEFRALLVDGEKAIGFTTGDSGDLTNWLIVLWGRELHLFKEHESSLVSISSLKNSPNRTRYAAMVEMAWPKDVI